MSSMSDVLDKMLNQAFRKISFRVSSLSSKISLSYSCRKFYAAIKSHHHNSIKKIYIYIECSLIARKVPDISSGLILYKEQRALCLVSYVTC